MVQTRRTLQDHLPQLKTLPSTLGAATPGDFVPKMEPPALNAGSTFFTWALFRVILSAPMPHHFYSPSPKATFRNPPLPWHLGVPLAHSLFHIPGLECQKARPKPPSPHLPKTEPHQ